METPREEQGDLPEGDSVVPSSPFLRRVERHISRRIVSGFILLVPVLVTLWVILIAFFFVDGLFRGTSGLLSVFGDDRPWDFPGIGVLITLVVLYLVGAFFAGERLQRWQDAILSRIPIFRGIYGVARQATKALSGPVGHHFSRVVFVEWPRPGVRALGFVTGHLESHDGNDANAKVAVYIPTVPNPTSGMLAFVSEEDIIESNITVQDAMKTVFSGGIVLPEPPHDVPRLQTPPQVEESPDD